MPPKSANKGIKIPAKLSYNIDDVLAVIGEKSSEYKDEIEKVANLSLVPEINDFVRKLMTLKYAVTSLRNLGAEVEECNTCREIDGKGFPVVLARIGLDESKPTIFVYCQFDNTGQTPVHPSSAKYIRGRAVVDAASFLIWINIVKAHKEAMVPLPYNIKMCLDPLSRSEVTQLIEVLHKKKETFLADIEFSFACLGDGIDRKIPNIIYGVRGICNFIIKIRDIELSDMEDENNGTLLDMLYMLDSLVDQSGHITIDGIYDDVPEMTAQERSWFSTININLEFINYYMSVNGTTTNEKVEFLERIWRLPALTVNGVENSKEDPNELIGDFTVFTVPNQTPNSVRKLVLKFLKNKWNQRNSQNEIEFGMNYWSWPWRADQSDPKYKALVESVISVYGSHPQYILSGSNLTFPPILRKLTDKNVIIYSIGSFYDYHLTQDERLPVRHFIKDMKVITKMLHYVENGQNIEEKKRDSKTVKNETKKKGKNKSIL